MRADRLLSIMLLLQARGQLTAQALAQELEVSERTIYRDVEALSIAGVPVYSESGPGGGIGLLASYRTTLTALTAAEVTALFTLSIPGPLEDVGLSATLRSALRKLAATLPAAQRNTQWAPRHIHVDATGWSQHDGPAPHLRTLHAAVEQMQPVLLCYRRTSGAEVATAVEPYGLVAKAGAWQLVYARRGRIHVIAVAELLDVQLLAGSFTRPADFDLVHFWESWCVAAAHRRVRFAVTARVSPLLLDHCVHHCAAHAITPAASAPQAADGRPTLLLHFDSFESARAQLLALGNAVEVLAPESLRRSIADFAAQIVKIYQERNQECNDASPAHSRGQRDRC